MVVKRKCGHNCWFFFTSKNHHRMCHCVASRNYQPWKNFLENCCHWSNFMRVFFRLCLSFFRSPKRTLGVYSQDSTKEIVGLRFSHTVSKVIFLSKNWTLTKSCKASNLNFLRQILDSKKYQILKLLGPKLRFWSKIVQIKPWKDNFWPI